MSRHKCPNRDTHESIPATTNTTDTFDTIETSTQYSCLKPHLCANLYNENGELVSE